MSEETDNAVMEILTFIIAAKMSSAPLATGLYKLKWSRAWVEGTPAPRVLVIDDRELAV